MAIHSYNEGSMPHVILEEMEESSAYTHAAEFGDVQVNNENLMASVKMIMP